MNPKNPKMGILVWHIAERQEDRQKIRCAPVATETTPEMPDEEGAKT